MWVENIGNNKTEKKTYEFCSREQDKINEMDGVQKAFCEVLYS